MRVLLIFFVFLFGKCFGQEPAYFRIGEQELANKQVYSLCQTPDGLLYAATNQGLFVYKNGEFIAIPDGPKKKGKALFSLVKNSKGELFGANLKGQILHLKNGEMRVFHQLEEEFIFQSIRIAFDHQDRLIIHSKKVLTVENDQCQVLSERNARRLRIQTNGTITFSLDRPIGFFELSVSGELIFHKNKAREGGDFRQVFEFNDRFIHYYETTGKLLVEDDWEIDLQREIELKAIRGNELWGRNKFFGVTRVNLGEELSAEEYEFNESFISDICEGVNGSIFLGTFGEGVIVLPSLSQSRFGVQFPKERFMGVCVVNDDVFFTARGKEGTIYRSRFGSFEKIFSSEVAKFDLIFHTPNYSGNLISDYPYLTFDGRSKLYEKLSFGSVKDVQLVSSASTLLATAKGIYASGSTFDHWKKEFSCEGIHRLSSERFESAAYSESENLIYSSLRGTLTTIDPYGKKRTVLVNGKPVSCSQVLLREGKVWCATTDQGILILHNGECVDKISQESGLNSQLVYKILIEKDILYVNHANGFQMLNLKTNEWKELGITEGIPPIKEFALQDSLLWLIAENSPYCVDLNKLNAHQSPRFHFELESILFDQDTVNRNEVGDFGYETNSAVFNLQFIGIECERETQLYYRMTGVSDDWNIVDPHKGKIEYTTLRPGKYTFQAFVKYRGKRSEMVEYSFEIHPPFWQTSTFFLLMILTVGLIVFIVMRYQVHKVRREAKERLKLQKMETQMIESELKALRSQMNPHFIFNSLNSIQNLILKEQTEDSYDYVVLFSELVRSTLSYSNMDFIPIEKEVEFINVYLSLEKLRFKESFSFEINSNGISGISIPSLIIQPFIENALLHGLIHKDGQKIVRIDFELSDSLLVTVTDNGIGREEAMKIQKRQHSKHESFALKAILERLEILGKQVGDQDTGYTFEDVMSDDGKVAGTRVKIRIPHKKLY